MLSRFSSAALSGTSTDRKTSVSSRNDSRTTAAMNSGSRSLTRSPTSAKLAVWPPTWARAGLPVEHGREHVGPEPLDRVERGVVLRSGGRERDQRRDAGVGVHLGGRDGGDARVGRDGVEERLDHARVLARCRRR